MTYIHPHIHFTQGEALKDTAWQRWTFQEYHDQSLLFGRALMSLGFQPHGVINILGFNAVRGERQ